MKPTARGPLAEPPMAPPDGRAALVSELVPLDDTIKSCMRFGLLLTLTCIGLELTSVLYESPEQFGTVGTDVRGRCVAPR